jgi:DNA-binding response OmpR family regulator
MFLSGAVERPSVRRGMEMGADDYLTKPFHAV